MIRHRGDTKQADLLEKWLEDLMDNFQDSILDIDINIAQMRGRLRVPHPENTLDKLITATALIYGLTVVTRNEIDFVNTGVKLFNPFIQ